ncbi:hypothetical protein [Mesorhizobium opportunistum]|uniref:hypothetical protein n=1 Tax=Mesorhizobium opportunistum TaxID=593909 RepID=UPI003336F082
MLFTSLAQARAVLASWRTDYNFNRRRGSDGRPLSSSPTPSPATGHSAAHYDQLRACARR